MPARKIGDAGDIMVAITIYLVHIFWPRLILPRKKRSIYGDAPKPSAHCSECCQLVELLHHHILSLLRSAESGQVQFDLWSDLTYGWSSKGTA